MTKEVSPSEYQQMTAAGKVKRDSINGRSVLIAVVVGAIVLCGLSFLAGESYQKSHSKAATNTAAGQFGAQGRMGGFGGNRQRPAIGQVTAISNDSITINDERTGSSKTFKITSDTTVSNNGSATSVSDIATGDTVFVQASPSDASTASRVILNPSFSGSSQGSSGSSSSQSTTQDPTLTN